MAAEYSPVLDLTRICPLVSYTPHIDATTQRASDLMMFLRGVNDWLTPVTPVTDYASGVLGAHTVGAKFFEQQEAMRAISEKFAVLQRYEPLPRIELLNLRHHNFEYPQTPTPSRRRDRRVTPVRKVVCLGCGQPVPSIEKRLDPDSDTSCIAVPPHCMTCLTRYLRNNSNHIRLVPPCDD